MNVLLPWEGVARRKGLDDGHVFLLAVLGATAFFDGYDASVHTIALTQIRESFDLTKSAASALYAVIFLGALPAIALTRKADTIGRRKLLIASVLGYTCFSGLSALAPNAGSFTAAQFMQQVFLVAESAIVWTMAAEELPATARGFGFGVLGMNNALGVGLAAIVFGGILDPNGISWRWMYVLSVPPLLFVAFLRRRLPESRRFVEAQDRGTLARRWHEIFRHGVRRWLLLVVAVTFLVQLVHQATTFTIDFLETDRGLSATTASFMLVLAGLPGIPFMIAAGAFSDRFGRRLVGCTCAIGATVGAMGFFWLPGGPLVLLPCMSVSVVGQLGAFPILQGITSEMFPTALRSSASAWVSFGGVLGRSCSLALAAPLLDRFSQSLTATFLGTGPVLAVVLIALFVPDTHGRELEEISGEAPVALLDAPAALMD